MDGEMTNCSRRTFLLAGAAISVPAQTPTPALTAGMVVDRIKANVGIPWRQQTVDNIVAGNADTPVKGIATTMMATLDVCKRANAAGKNMVITHESTFFSHQDTIDRTQSITWRRTKRIYINATS
jgi:hypothetical protein